jgi:hypothetical protein
MLLAGCWLHEQIYCHGLWLQAPNHQVSEACHDHQLCVKEITRPSHSQSQSLTHYPLFVLAGEGIRSLLFNEGSAVTAGHEEYHDL